MPLERDDNDERAARVDHMIAELRAHQARVRAYVTAAKRLVRHHDQELKRIDRRRTPREPAR